MEDLPHYLKQLGLLHDAMVSKMDVGLASQRIVIEIEDIHANFDGLPGYNGPRLGQFVFHGITRLSTDFATDHDQLKVFEFSASEEQNGKTVSIRFSPAGKLSMHYLYAEVLTAPEVSHSDLSAVGTTLTPPEIRIVLNHAAAALQVESHAEAEALLAPLLALGSPEAEFLMGEILEMGDRHEESWQWLLRAARKGHAQAALRVSHLLIDDLGVSDVERDRMLALAAKAKLEPAFHSLGVNYATGDWDGLSDRGVNHRKSFQWYLRAAKAGNATSAFEVGYMYLYGEGVEKNVTNAIAWLQRAGLGGDYQAAHCLESLFAEGSDTIAANPELQLLWRKVYLLHDKHPRPYFQKGDRSMIPERPEAE